MPNSKSSTPQATSDPIETTASIQSTEPIEASEPVESFDAIFAEHEKTHPRNGEQGNRQIAARVVAIHADSVFLDIGFKTEGVLPLATFAADQEPVKAGDVVLVSVKGRNEEGYYDLSRFKMVKPTDWTSLEQAFSDKTVISGTVTGLVKGGLSVDVGVRAFMPGSRSGARDAAELEKLIGQEIRCKIIQLDAVEEDVVVDRRIVTEEEDRSNKERRYSEVKEGEVVHGTVRSLAEYGAFVDLGGVDGLLHVSDLAWTRVQNPASMLTVGQQIDVKVLKADSATRRISVGLKQLQPHPWEGIENRYKTGERVQGVVTRVMDFGAFVELAAGIEGLIHVSEMSWAKKVRKAGDMLKPGDTVEAVILAVNPTEHRLSLGLKQTLDDPWAEAAEKFRVGSVVEGTVASFTKFGAFLRLSEGVEGLVHISEITAEKHLNHPQEVLKIGQQVKALVLEVDTAKRQMRLSMKQMLPVSVDEYIAEHTVGDVVSGRIVEVVSGSARVELGEGIFGTCVLPSETAAIEQTQTPGKTDLSSLTSMLSARWKGSTAAERPKREEARTGQIRSFKIISMDTNQKLIDIELV